MPRILALLLVVALGASALLSDPVELYYFANQTPYEVKAFDKDGLPVMDASSDGALAGYEGPRHKAWWVEGELPLEAGYAMPLIDFRLKRVAERYGERGAERRYEASINWDRFAKTNFSRNREGVNALAVAWIRDGEVVAWHVTGRLGEEAWHEESLFEVAESERSGRPFVWKLSLDRLPLRWEETGLESLYFEGLETNWRELAASEDALKRGALHYAAASGLAPAARSLIDAREELVKLKDETDRTPLSYAAMAGREEVARLLVENKASLSDGWEDLNSIVRRAASHGHYETLVALAPDKARGQSGLWHYSWSASDALNENYEDIAIHLLDRGAKFELLRTDPKKMVFGKFAAGYPDLGFRLMDKWRIKGERLEVDGLALSHAVASYADARLLEKVSSLGVSMQSQDPSQAGSPVEFAIGGGNVDAICWMVEQGGVKLEGEKVAKAYARAIRDGQLASIECLIGYGLEVNQEIVEGITPLAYALTLRQFEIAKLLVEAGGVFRVDQRDADLMVSRILEADEPAFFDAAAGSENIRSASIFGEFSLFELAAFFEAEAAIQALGGAQGGSRIRGVSEVDQAPKLLTRLNVPYTEALKERFGNREVLVDVVIASGGQPVALRSVDGELPRELIAVVESGLVNSRFEPARAGGEAVPVVIRAKLPLRADYDPEKVVPLSEVEEKPTAKHWNAPIYPFDLQHRRVRDSVVVEFVLLADGSVRDARPIEFRHASFAKAAVLSVQQTIWEPAKVKGRPVACRVRVPVHFSP